MSAAHASPPVTGVCPKCPQPLDEHGETTGKCRGHARVRDAEGKATGEFRPCRLPPVDGATVCASHGLNKQGRAAAARAVAMDKAVRRLQLGGKVVVDPAEAMLDQVREAAANVEVYRYLVALLGPAVDGGSGEVEGDDEDGPFMDDIDRSELGGTIAGRVDPANWKAAPHVYVVMYNDERERLMRFAKMCRDAGVEEHRIRMAENLAGQYVDAQTAIVSAIFAAVRRLLDAGGLTEAGLRQLERGEVPRLIRGVIEARLLSERS